MLSKSYFEKLEKLWSQEMFRTKCHAIVKWKMMKNFWAQLDVLPPTDDQNETDFTTGVVCL